jgi:hypothetical protein
MAKKWDFGAMHLCHSSMALNPASPGWRFTCVCKHTRFAITLTSSLQIPDRWFPKCRFERERIKMVDVFFCFLVAFLIGNWNEKNIVYEKDLC